MNLTSSKKISKIEISTIGIHSCRYNSFEVVDDTVIIYPCGVFLTKFDLKIKKLIKRLKISDSIIHAMYRNLNYLLVSCHNGDSCIIDIENFEIINKFKFHDCFKINSISASDDMNFICGCTEYYVDPKSAKVYNGALVILEREENNNEDKNIEIKYRFHSVCLADEAICEFRHSNDKENQRLVMIGRINTDSDIEELKHFYIENQEVLLEKGFYYVKEFSLRNNSEKTLLKTITLDDSNQGQKMQIIHSKKYNEYIFLNYSKRIIKLLDMKSLKIILIIKFEGGGCLGPFEIKNDILYVANLFGSLLSLDLSNFFKTTSKENNFYPINVTVTKNYPKLIVDSISESEGIDIILNQILYNEEYLSQYNFSLNLFSNNLFWTNEKGLFAFDLSENKYVIKMESIIKNSGCGVAINQTNKMIAVGDLEQNITIFNSIQYNNDCDSVGEEEFIFFKLKAKDPIRALLWDEILNELYVGTIGGKILECDVKNMKLVELFNFGHTVTCMKLFHLNYDKNSQDNISYLISSTTSGHVQIIKIKGDIQKEYELINTFLAHAPDPFNEDMRFGSLNIKAEIWSLTFCPNSLINTNSNFHLITASEDQSIKIWEFSSNNMHTNPRLANQFKNHQLAVTSVDWKPMKILNGEVLVSCSDDRTINIYDPTKNFELIKTLKTDFIYDWHTITYISLEENGIHLAISTQNGFIVIFSLETWEAVFCQKLHLGGIEGLSWKGDTLVTCANDLNLSSLKIL